MTRRPCEAQKARPRRRTRCTRCLERNISPTFGRTHALYNIFCLHKIQAFGSRGVPIVFMSCFGFALVPGTHTIDTRGGFLSPTWPLARISHRGSGACLISCDAGMTPRAPCPRNLTELLLGLRLPGTGWRTCVFPGCLATPSTDYLYCPPVNYLSVL